MFSTFHLTIPPSGRLRFCLVEEPWTSHHSPPIQTLLRGPRVTLRRMECGARCAPLPCRHVSARHATGGCSRVRWAYGWRVAPRSAPVLGHQTTHHGPPGWVGLGGRKVLKRAQLAHLALSTASRRHQALPRGSGDAGRVPCVRSRAGMGWQAGVGGSMWSEPSIQAQNSCFELFWA